MVKAKCVYIWEGDDCITITRGYEFEQVNGDIRMLHSKIKHRGMFNKFFPVTNLRDVFLGEPKKLRIGQNKILEGWKVLRVKMDLQTRRPFIPDLPPSLVSQIDNLTNQVEILTKRLHEAEDINITTDNKDLFQQKMMDRMKKASNVKNIFYSQDGGMFNQPFNRSFLVRPPGTTGGSQ